MTLVDAGDRKKGRVVGALDGGCGAERFQQCLLRGGADAADVVELRMKTTGLAELLAASVREAMGFVAEARQEEK